MGSQIPRTCLLRCRERINESERFAECWPGTVTGISVEVGSIILGYTFTPENAVMLALLALIEELKSGAR